MKKTYAQQSIHFFRLLFGALSFIAVLTAPIVFAFDLLNPLIGVVSVGGFYVFSFIDVIFFEGVLYD